MGSQAFDPSTREEETGVIWLGGERSIRWEETGAKGNLRSMQSEDRIAPLV